MLGTTYGSIKEMIFQPPSIEQELYVRTKICNADYDLSPLLIFESAQPIQTIKLYLNSVVYEDTKHLLIKDTT